MCAKFWILIYLSHQILIFYIIAPPTLKFPDLCWISTIDLTNFGSPELVCKMLNFQIGLSRQIYLAYQMLSLYIRPAKSWIPNKIGCNTSGTLYLSSVQLMKQMSVLVIILRRGGWGVVTPTWNGHRWLNGINQGFWSHLGRAAPRLVFRV